MEPWNGREEPAFGNSANLGARSAGRRIGEARDSAVVRPYSTLQQHQDQCAMSVSEFEWRVNNSHALVTSKEDSCDMDVDNRSRTWSEAPMCLQSRYPVARSSSESDNGFAEWFL
jgi:hypothetical protein